MGVRKREPLSKSKVSRYFIKKHIFERDRGICYLCGVPVSSIEHMTIDHVTPITLGGTNDLENLRVTHEFCNRSKQSLTLKQFRDLAKIWASQTSC